MKTGILGGTFDPIHIGHLIVAQDCLIALNLDRIIFIPCAQPPHKDRSDITDAGMRFKMVELAIEGNDRFEISDIEILRGGSSYTVDTLKQLRKELPQDTEIYFLMGEDGVLEIHTWKTPEEIFRLSKVVVMTRAGYDTEEKTKNLPGQAIFQVVHSIEISSTEIRKRCREGKSISYLVPEKVEGLIVRKGLYLK